MSLATDIITTIRSSDNGKSMELKQLRNSVLPPDKVDKQSKKLFKSTIKELEKDDVISLNSDGIVKLSKSERSTSGDKKSKKKKEKKKRKRESKEDDDDVDEDVEEKKKKQSSVDEDDIEDTKEDQNDNNEDQDNTTNNQEDIDSADKNKPCKNNPQVSRYDVCTGFYFVYVMCMSHRTLFFI